MRTKIVAAALSAVVAAACAVHALADNLRYNNFMPPKALEALVAVKFFEELPRVTNGKVTGQVFSAGQLLGGQATLSGIRDGVVDAGLIIASLTASEIPHVYMMEELRPFADNPWTAAAATNESAMLTCAACRDELARYNAVWVGGHSASPWYLMCRRPIKQFSDLRGRKVRITGGSATRMINALGGVGVAMPPGEIAPALQQGQIDCAVGNLAWLTTLGLLGTVQVIVDQPLGASHGLGLFVFNRNSLARLGAAEKQALLKLMPKYIAMLTQMYKEQEEEARSAARSKGIQFWTPSEEFKQAMAAFRNGEIKAVAADMAKFGARDGEEAIRQHLANLAKWQSIAAQIGNDPDAYARVLWEKIFSGAKL